jgi:DNA-directed RNA polymerase specialized sigma24 family protein
VTVLHRADLERAEAHAEPTGFAALFDDSFDRVYAFVSRRSATREQAEATTQRVLERAFYELPRYDGSRPFSAWLLAIVKQELAARTRETRSASIPYAGGTPG